MKASIVWQTPDGEKYLAYMARVSNPKATLNDPFKRLIQFLIRKKHWSPFSMVNVCVEVECSRDVSRQVLRHKSFDFQEFSGRYAAYEEGLLEPREARLQDKENRQNSLPSDDQDLNLWWFGVQRYIIGFVESVYEQALKRGIAKEVARAILPEGLTPTKMHINGTLRSWIHYFDVRCGDDTQKEHRELAQAIRDLVFEQYPSVKEALNA